uniref:Uncharacterized protein n=1 Tax=Picea glauca TaxID=3330 RepID=A0A101LZ47_PICGL|nr:hypothetical protein ABT39_MTgene4872 [Picea glauca]QHR92362.1 hypothetical protein Q903MT_gene6405 [Picea sitchensis]
MPRLVLKEGGSMKTTMLWMHAEDVEWLHSYRYGWNSSCCVPAVTYSLSLAGSIELRIRWGVDVSRC